MNTPEHKYPLVCRIIKSNVAIDGDNFELKYKNKSEFIIFKLIEIHKREISSFNNRISTKKYERTPIIVSPKKKKNRSSAHATNCLPCKKNKERDFNNRDKY